MYTYINLYIYIYIHICIHTYKHIRFTPCDLRSLFLRPAVCIWTPLSDLSRTERPITFHFPGCDFGGIFLGPAGCIRTHSAAILMTRGRILRRMSSFLVAFWSSSWTSIGDFFRTFFQKVSQSVPLAPQGQQQNSKTTFTALLLHYQVYTLIHMYICILMCEALPPTLEKSTRRLGVMDHTGWQSFICIRI